MTAYRPLTYEDIKKENYLHRLAELIYETDPYIYPAMFDAKQDAITILSAAIASNQDIMFMVPNIYIAEEYGEIIAILLWYKGNMQWNPHLFSEIAKQEHIALADTFEKVYLNYFKNYMCSDLESVISIINICVLPEYRSKGIGRKLLETFLQEHPKEKYELYCLEENMAARHLYETCGFSIVEYGRAFTIDDSDVGCVKMETRSNVN